MYSSSENVVRRSILASGYFPSIFSAASRPVMPCILISMSITSGICSSYSFTACCPLSPTADTSMSSCALSIVFSESDTRLSSSIITIFMSCSFLIHALIFMHFVYPHFFMSVTNIMKPSSAFIRMVPPIAATRSFIFFMPIPSPVSPESLLSSADVPLSIISSW